MLARAWLMVLHHRGPNRGQGAIAYAQMLRCYEASARRQLLAKYVGKTMLLIRASTLWAKRADCVAFVLACGLHKALTAGTPFHS